MNIKLKNLKNIDLIFIFTLILFRITLEINYLYAISKMYLEHVLLSFGVYKVDIVISKYIISWIVFIIFIIVILKLNITKLNKSSEILILALFMMSFIPSISLYGLANLDNKYLLFFILFWSLLLFFSNMLSCNSAIIKVSSFKNRISDRNKLIFFILIIIFCCIFIAYISIQYNGYKIRFSLDTNQQYDERLKFYSQGENRIFNYLRSWAMCIIIPFAGTLFFSKKKYYLVCIMAFFQLLLFGIDMQKMALFIFPAAILAYIFYRDKMINIVPIMLVTLNIFSLIEFFNGKSRFILENLIIRLYYLPAILSNCYYEFIEETKWYVIPASSIFKKLGFISDYYYSKYGLSYEIGNRYFGTYDISANTGMFGSAYSYGIYGIILVPIIYAILFALFDKTTKGLKINIYISIILIEVFAITGTSIFVVILPYGYILAILLLQLIKNNKLFYKSKGK